MSRLSDRKTRLTLETSASVRGRQIIVEIHPLTVALREKGRRTRLEISWESIFYAAARLAGDRLRAERKERKHGPR